MKIFDDHDSGLEETAGDIKSVKPGPVPLSSVRAGETVKVECLPVCCQASSRLCALGLTPGTQLRVLQNLFGPILLEVRGSRLSLGQGLAHKLLVSPIKNGACLQPGKNGRG